MHAINNMINSLIHLHLRTGSTGGVSFVKHVGVAYDTYRTKNGTLVSSFGGSEFTYFCSGHVHKQNEFGTGRGFVDTLYIFGEEAELSSG
jgi:hypothetical protein